jgi:hypothetical protein
LTFLADGKTPEGDDTPKDSPEQTCWNCGGKGHLATACTKPKKRRNGGGEKAPRLWKRTPPGADEPHEKTIAGTKWYWCGRCCFWNESHLTTDHVSRQANLVEDEASQVSGSGTTSTTGDEERSVSDPRVSFYGNVMRTMQGANK